MGRRRVNIYDEEMRQKAEKLLLSLIPKTGEAIGNSRLREQFLDQSETKLHQRFGDEVYWDIRNDLIEASQLERGRGKGGSIRLIAGQSRRKQRTTYRRESDLYKDFHETIRREWVKDNDIRRFVSEVSAHKRRKPTRGKWTIPDVLLVSVGNYTYIPGKSLEVTTFEVKPEDAYSVEGVYETASHSAFANESYLALHMREEIEPEILERLEKEAVRFGVGLVTFGDPANWDSFDVRVEAEHKIPSPRDVNDFLNQMSEDSKKTLLEDLK
jgi:hypothetical protein